MRGGDPEGSGNGTDGSGAGARRMADVSGWRDGASTSEAVIVRETAAGRMGMFNPSEIVIEAFIERLKVAFVKSHPGRVDGQIDVLERAARLSLTHVARSNALYTNLESTLLLTGVGVELLQGRQIERYDVEPDDWMHFVLAALASLTGFARGTVPGDDGRSLVVDADGGRREFAPSSTDGALLPYATVRSQLFVTHFLGREPTLDSERINGLLRQVPLPVPRDPICDPGSWGGLLRAAQIIGLGADPRFVQRSRRLFRQLEENGLHTELGYTSAADVVDTYPDRFWRLLLPQLPAALSYLKYTGDGRLWLARLNANILRREHDEGVATRV